MNVWRMKSVLFVLLLIGFGTMLQAQDPVQAPEGIPVESDWLYRQHYEQVQQIMSSPLEERASKLENFYRKLPEKAKMRQYMEGFFGQLQQQLQQAGKTGEAQALSSKMAELFPDSAPSLGQQFQTAFQNKNYEKAIELGEKLRASNPDDTQLTVLLAQSYIAAGKQEKAAEFSRKSLEILGPEKGVQFAVWLADYHSRQKQVDKAIDYYDQALSAYPQKTPPGWNEQQWKGAKATAYALKGSQAYMKKDFPAAVRFYQQSIREYGQNEQAYLFLGLSHWRQQELDEAMNAFARAVVLEKPGSAKARQYLEQIYKPRNNDSLEGLDELLDQARSEIKP